MGVSVALLRGINVSGKNIIRMADLQKCLGNAGLKDVRTYLQSGNVVFTSHGSDSVKSAKLIHETISKQFKLDVATLVLSGGEIQRLAKSNPLLPEGPVDERLFHATFLFHPVSPKLFNRLTLPLQPGEKAILKGNVILLHCPHGYGRTKITNAFFEKELSVPATTRNWRTVRALEEMTG